MNGFLIFLIIVGPIVLIFYKGYLYATKSQFNFKNELFLLTAIILKSSKNPTQQELNYVNSFLIREFGKRKSGKYLKIIQTLILSHNELDVPKAFKLINFEQDNYTKIQLLDFLIKISIIDKYLSKLEYNTLVKICTGIGLQTNQLNIILSKHNFVSEADRERKEQNRKVKTNQSNYKIKQALTILKLDERASNEEIKKAYRKLMLHYHPDKNLDIDQHLKQNSQDMFLKINDAYDLLKLKKGFK